MFYFLALNSGSVLPVMLFSISANTGMHGTSDNLFDSHLQEYINNTKTTFFEIFCIGYHFITACKVSTAISSLNERKKKI